jgi:hypothetical protein
MSYRLSRLATAFDPGAGLLRAEHFEMAYATTDIARAMAFFGDRLGIKKFRALEGELPAGGHIHIELAWVGTLMYELIEASGPGSELFMHGLPKDGGYHMRPHHLGYLLHDKAQWDGVLAQAAQNGWAVPHQSTNPLLDFCFVDVPELGHYLEYLLPSQMGLDFFDNVPRN